MDNFQFLPSLLEVGRIIFVNPNHVPWLLLAVPLFILICFIIHIGISDVSWSESHYIVLLFLLNIWTFGWSQVYLMQWSTLCSGHGKIFKVLTSTTPLCCYLVFSWSCHVFKNRMVIVSRSLFHINMSVISFMYVGTWSLTHSMLVIINVCFNYYQFLSGTENVQDSRKRGWSHWYY